MVLIGSIYSVQLVRESFFYIRKMMRPSMKFPLQEVVSHFRYVHSGDLIFLYIQCTDGKKHYIILTCKNWITLLTIVSRNRKRLLYYTHLHMSTSTTKEARRNRNLTIQPQIQRPLTVALRQTTISTMTGGDDGVAMATCNTIRCQPGNEANFCWKFTTSPASCFAGIIIRISKYVTYWNKS